MIQPKKAEHYEKHLISLGSALNKDWNYYQHVFLKECKYIEKKMIRHIIDDIKSSSDDFDEE